MDRRRVSRHDVAELRMTGGTLLIGMATDPEITFWQKTTGQERLSLMAGHQLRHHENAAAQLRRLADRVGLCSYRPYMTDAALGEAIREAIDSKRLSAVFLPNGPLPAPMKITVQRPPQLPLATTAPRPPDLWRMTPEKRVEEMNRRVAGQLTGDVLSAFEAAFTPEGAAAVGVSLIGFAAIGAALEAINLVPVLGIVVDGLLLGWAFGAAGMDGLRALILLVQSQKAAKEARTDAEINAAAQMRVEAVKVFGTALATLAVMFGIRRIGGGRAAEKKNVARPNRSRSPRESFPSKRPETGTDGSAAETDAIPRKDEAIHQKNISTDDPKINKSTEEIKDVDVNRTRGISAVEANSPHIAVGNRPPYAFDSRARDIIIQNDRTFVRVHGEGNQARSWMMRDSEIRDLSAKQIKDKFALPELPSYVSDVDVPAGTSVRLGRVGSQEGWGIGGGIQYELRQRLLQSAFKNRRPLQ